MSKLTGKCKKDFLYNRSCEWEWFIDNYSKTLQNALILEWFDSVGIVIYPYVPNETGYWAYNLEGKAKYYDRQEATEKAIEKADDIYNHKNQN